MQHLFHSPAWLKLKKQLNEDRNDLITQLIAQRSHDESMTLRGKIQMIDDILERYPVMLGSNDDND